jgi:hypothetical protein
MEIPTYLRKGCPMEIRLRKSRPFASLVRHAFSIHKEDEMISKHLVLFTAVLACGFQALTGSLVAATITAPPGTSVVSISYTLVNPSTGAPQSQADDFFVSHLVETDGTIHERADPLGPIVPGPNGTPNPASFTLPFGFVSGYGTIVGLYSPGLVSIALEPAAGSNALGQSFGSVFSGITEAALALDLVAGNTTPGTTSCPSSCLTARAAMIAFLDANASLFPSFNGLGTPVTASNTNFSNGAAAGTFGFTLVSGGAASSTPEPSSLLLVAPVLLLLVSRKRMMLRRHRYPIRIEGASAPFAG